MPFFIGYEPKPFSKESFQPGEAEGEDDQLQGENTIRWRFNPMNPVSVLGNALSVFELVEYSHADAPLQ
jgi:hypothetical protein